jgi:hypothetical protein
MSNMRTFSIFRYDPDEQSAAQMQTYHIALRASDRMLLDVLERIKAEDNSLAYRRSCREGNLRLRRDEYQRQERPHLPDQQRSWRTGSCCGLCQACR